ncbi:NAD(+) synthase [Flavobacteriales bacterium]|nr:NAD(+) synthase [Flavobacteriales bacterium]
MKNKDIIVFITEWMQQYVKQANSNGFVIGVSGGIDSALTSTLAAKTGRKVLCVEMPIHQEKEQVNRANQHIKWLKSNFNNVESVCINLSDLYDQFVSSVEDDKNSVNYDIALVNSRARLRMTTLYYLAQLNNLLVAGTGNKVEDFGIGFFTKYGDGGVDLSPIADLLKTEVYSLCETLGVAKSILDAPPTDGLWGDDRTDEDQIGASYPELEWAMSFEGDKNDISERQKQVLIIYNQYHSRNKHKMIAIPVCEIPR